jgi:membrane fusion protein (multidrug efflux system)
MRNSVLEQASDAAEPSIARRTPSHSPQVERENTAASESSSNRSAPAAPSVRRLPGDRPLCHGGGCLCPGGECLDQSAGRGSGRCHRGRSDTPVKNDDRLFNIDPEPYRIALANAEAQLGVARDQARTLVETYRSRLNRSMNQGDGRLCANHL